LSSVQGISILLHRCLSALVLPAVDGANPGRAPDEIVGPLIVTYARKQEE